MNIRAFVNDGMSALAFWQVWIRVKLCRLARSFRRYFGKCPLLAAVEETLGVVVYSGLPDQRIETNCIVATFQAERFRSLGPTQLPLFLLVHVQDQQHVNYYTSGIVLNR